MEKYNQNSVVALATRSWIRHPRHCFDCRLCQVFLFISQAPTPLPKPTQPPIQWSRVVLPSGKEKRREPHHLPPNSTEVKTECSLNPTPSYILISCIGTFPGGCPPYEPRLTAGECGSPSGLKASRTARGPPNVLNKEPRTRICGHDHLQIAAPSSY
jgi:hypothetical protein